jgi:NAD+ kinase
VVAVAFVVHPERPIAAELADRAGQWLKAHGHTVVSVVPSLRHGDGLDGEDVDLAVSLGGDGTMLRTVAMAAGRGIPILGVNLGQLGYLTEVEPAALEDALERFAAGDYRIEERMTLEVTVTRAASTLIDQSDTTAAYLVLNEAVVEKTGSGHTVRLSASIAGRPFVTYLADGLLVCTPTGSTAYNLSARGPILSPRLRAIVVTPISAHMLFDRTIVLEPEQWLRLEVAGPRPGILVVDGVSVAELAPGDAVECREGPVNARLVTLGHRDFHSILRSRFHLADR